MKDEKKGYVINGKSNRRGDINETFFKFKKFDFFVVYVKTREEKYDVYEEIVFDRDLYFSDEPVLERQKIEVFFNRGSE